MKDYCTMWFESMYGVDISDCCYKHDESLSTTRFYKCLSSKIDVFSAAIVTVGGFIGAWVKYPKQMWRRL